MDPDKPLKVTMSAEEKADTANIIIGEAGPIGGTKTTLAFTTTISSADIVTRTIQPAEAFLDPVVKELLVETVERSKKHFVEGLKISFSLKDWSVNFELRREPEKVTTTKVTGKKEIKG